MYPSRDSQGSKEGVEGIEEEWHTWGRPPNGFIDLGCVSRLTPNLLSKVADRVQGEWSTGPYTDIGGRWKHPMNTVLVDC